MTRLAHYLLAAVIFGLSAQPDCAASTSLVWEGGRGKPAQAPPERQGGFELGEEASSGHGHLRESAITDNSMNGSPYGRG